MSTARKSNSPASDRRDAGGLLGRLPLVASWLRRRSARALARERSPRSVAELATAVTRGGDARVFTVAMDLLSSLDEQPLIDAACVVWAASRHPALARLQASHGWVASAPPELTVLTALGAGRPDVVNEAGAAVIGPLLQSCHDVDPAIAERARAWLRRFSNPECIDELCARWAATREEILGEAIVEAGYRAGQPPAVRVLTALKTAQAESLVDLGEGEVAHLVAACSDVEPLIRDRAAIALRRLRNQDAIDEVCRVVLAGNDPRIQAIALEAGYRPRDDHDRALFFFLTGQRSRYEDLDFDGSLLRGCYELAGAELRRRLRSALTAAGRADVLSVVGGNDRRSRLSAMTAEEAEFLVARLAAQREWARLWSLAFELPYRWGVAIVRTLTPSGWRPEQPDERATFDELAGLAIRTLADPDEGFCRSLPPAVRRAHVRVSSIVNDVAFSPDGSSIALALRRRKVVLWDYRRAAVQGQLGRFHHAISRVAYTPGGILLCAERSTRPQEACAIYARVEGQATRKLGDHRGGITSIEPLSDVVVLSTGRDGRVALWEIGPGRLVRERRVESTSGQTGAWARSARVSADGRLAVLLYDGLSLVRLPDLDPLSAVALPGKTKCAAFTPDGRGLVVGQFDGEFRVYPLQGDSIDDRPAAFGRLAGQAQGVEVIAGRSVVVTAGSEGTVAFTSWPNRAAVGRVSVPGARLTSLRLSPDRSFMALGDSDASLTLWDLRVLDVPLMLARPLGLAVPVHLSAVRALATEAALPAEVRDALRFVECLLRFRFRYDIEVDELAAVRQGEFEVEVA